MATKVIHVNDMPNYPDAVYIGRAAPGKGLRQSYFANPYKIGVDGDRAGARTGGLVMSGTLPAARGDTK